MAHGVSGSGIGCDTAKTGIGGMGGKPAEEQGGKDYRERGNIDRKKI